MKLSDVFYENWADEDAGGIAVYIRSFIKCAEGVEIASWSSGKTDRVVIVGERRINCRVLFPSKHRWNIVPETIRCIYYIWKRLGEISLHKDAIIFHSSTYFWPYLFRKKETISVVIIHGTNMPVTSMAVGKAKARFVIASDWYAIRRADKIILVSQEGLDYYRNKHPRHADKMVFFPTFSDKSIFYPGDLEGAKNKLGLEGRTVLCYVGRLATQKKVDSILRIFKKIVSIKGECFLCIVGDGPNRNKLESLAKELKVEEKVRFFGNIPNHEVRTFFNASVLSFALSYWEGTAKTILESLACGTPVIASDVADNRQIITNGSEGYVLDSDDEKRAAEFAISIMDNYRKFSDNALKTGKKYCASEIVPKIIKEVRNVAQESQ